MNPIFRKTKNLYRSVVCLIGSAAFAWVLHVTPIFWSWSGTINAASYIIAGDLFKPNILKALASKFGALPVAKWDRPSNLGSVAIVDLRLLDDVINGRNSTTVDQQIVDTMAAVSRSLVNSPADPFLWSALFWLDNLRNGFDPHHLDYLRLSYLTGPNEGWIAIKRNRLALALFRQLPPDLASDAVTEFSQLVDSSYIAEAADIFVGAGWPVHEKLLASLRNVKIINRQDFAKTVYRLGVDVSVPGVPMQEYRPWN